MTPLRILILCLAFVVAGCAKETPKHAEDEHAEHHEETGPHGGEVVELDPEAVRLAGIAADSAQSRPIEVTVDLPGEIKLNAETAMDVRPTYPGRVVELHAALGTHVRRGQPLAVIHSSESLSEYTVESPGNGTVIARPVNRGAIVGPETALFTIADLGSVWFDFPIHLQHLGRIRQGQLVHVRLEPATEDAALGRIAYVGPLLDEDTRTTFGRVVLPNPRGMWQPGRLATAVVVLESVTVPVAVPEEAIVRAGGGPAVFRADGDHFELEPVETGRTDGTTTEIVRGLERGAMVVTKQAILLKAELEKEAGGHDH